MKNERSAVEAFDDENEDTGPRVSLVDLLTWLGEGKRLISITVLATALAAIGISLWLPPLYTAHASLLPPGAQQQSGSSAALASLGALGGLAGGLTGKSPDELYVALLKSDSVVRALDQRFKLRDRYELKNFEQLRRALPDRVRIGSDKKSGVINVEVDDRDPKFAADLANAHVPATNEVLDRLAVNEAQQRRGFFQRQLEDTKENLVKAEQQLRRVQEKSGVIVLDKQAEALISGAALLRAQIAEREVQQKVLRTSATARNPDVMRLDSELAAMRSELARLESSRGGRTGSSVDLPVGKLPEAAIDYVRARRELKLQETLLESMVRQLEVAKLDEAKEGSALQPIDKAMPPDAKSKPARVLIVASSTLAALLAASLWVIVRRYGRLARELDPQSEVAYRSLARAWRLRGG